MTIKLPQTGSCHLPWTAPSAKSICIPSGISEYHLGLREGIELSDSPVGTAMMTFLFFLAGFASYVTPAYASWDVTYPKNLWGIKDSCVVIPCTFSFPGTVTVTDGITAIWFKEENDQRITIFHSTSPQTADARFHNRTELLGNPLAYNCTLLLRHLTSPDSGKYNFRFEVHKVNSWTQMKGLQLTITDKPVIPTIAAPEDLSEGVPATFNCSSPYVCPYDHSSLRWLGYNTETSRVSGMAQLDTMAAIQKQTLQTSLTWKDHKHKIGCQTSVGTQTAMGEVTLHVKHAPKGVKVSQDPSTKNIRVGDAVSLTCNVSSSHPGVTAYRWFKDGVACGMEQVKIIKHVSREDYGLYHCEAENSRGTGVAEAVTLFVFSAVLSITPLPSVREGETVTLTCNVPGEDKQEIHYSWFKNNIWFKEGRARILIFQEVHVEDTGYYACKVQNDQGSEMSTAISLTIFYPPRTPSLTLFQETQKGQLAIVYCTVDSNPQSTVSLFHDKRLLATTSSHVAPNQRLSITTTRNSLKLEIQKVIPEDEGEYRCVATNKYGNATAASFFSAQTARVVAFPSNELIEGEQVTLTCTATVRTEDDTVYTWYKNARWLQEGMEKVLILSAVASGDAGTFHCVARNKKERYASPPIALRVFYSPRLPVMSSFLETQGGHLGIIQCTVDSDPPSEIALYKGDILVGSTNIAPLATDPRLHVTSFYNTLKVTIEDLLLDDEGEYVCAARNRYGEATATMDFTAETPRIIVKPSSEVLEGKAIQLFCALTSNFSTPTNFSWYKDDLRLPEGLGDLLMFRQVTVEDEGRYQCRVETQGASKASHSASVSVLYPPRNLRVLVFMEAEKGTTAIFQCLVESNPPATLTLRKGEEIVAATSSKSNVASPRISITTGHNTLRVEMRSLVPEDEGSYNVTATNPYGASSRLLHFQVQTARILVTPSPEVLEGDKVSLSCDIMGRAQDDATFSWYRNSKLLPGSSASILTFPQITHEEAGSYYCKAHGLEDQATISISPSVSVTVFYPPRAPQLTTFLQTQDSCVAVIHCTVESEPQAHLAILKGQELLASSVSISPPGSQRIKISSTYNSLKVVIWDVVMEDEGAYVCSANNRYGKASSVVTFTAGTTKIWISPPDVLEGNVVNLTCAVDTDALGEIRYAWYKNNRWYAEGTSKTLMFPQATVADAGTYYCTVKTQERIRNSSLSTLNVLYPPRNVLVTSFLETQKARLAIILCTVDSNPPSLLSLHHADQVLVTSSSQIRGVPAQKLKAAFSSNSLRVEIQAINLEDEGRYECVASSPLGKARASVNFSVEATRLVIKPGPDVRDGQHVSLICEDATSPAAAIYTWYKDSKWLGEGSTASFLLQAVTPRDMGSYSCQVHNRKGVRTSPPIILRVHYMPRKPVLTSFLETQSGNQAVVQCAVESYPPSDLMLYRGNVAVASSRTPGNLPTSRLIIHTSHNSLKVDLKEVLLEDEGLYHCLANNTYGVATSSIRFSVERAKIIFDPSPEVPEGTTANLTCMVASRAATPMNYTWYKNSRWLQDGPDRSLLLGRVTSDDSGAYHCQAAGSTSAAVILNVLYAPKHPSLSVFLDSHNGRLAVISCKVDSHPCSRLALYKGSQLLADTNSSRSPAGWRFISFPSHNSLRLEIRDVTTQDSGLYMCQAHNSFGNTTSSVVFNAGLFSDLNSFKILAGVSTALVCIAAVGGLAFGVQKKWSWLYKKWIMWRQQKRSREEVGQVQEREAAIQLNEQNPDTPPLGRFCFSYRRLPRKAEGPHQEALPELSCTSAL